MKIRFSEISIYLLMAIVAIASGAGLVANIILIWEMFGSN